LAKSREQKKQIVEGLADKFKQAKVVVFSSYAQRNKKGLDVEVVRKLKDDLEKIEADYTAVKKTLLRLALEKNFGKDFLDVKSLEGSLGVLFGYSDVVEPVKVLYKTAKKNESIAVYSGIMDGKLLLKEELDELATLPSKEILIGRLVGMIGYPLSGLVNVLEGNIRGLVNVLNQISEKK